MDKTVTYRMFHEAAAGTDLCDEFFMVTGIEPDVPVKCNCTWDDGHGERCDIVVANELISNNKRQSES